MSAEYFNIENQNNLDMEIKNDKLFFARVRNVKVPDRGTSLSAGIDFYVPDDFNDGKPYMLVPGNDILVPSGIKARVPHGYMLMAADKTGIVVSKSSIEDAYGFAKPTATESILKVGGKIVDEDFQGEIFIHIINIGRTMGRIVPGEKLAQFILVPVSYATLQETTEDRLYTSESERGTGCLSSTGLK